MAASPHIRTHNRSSSTTSLQQRRRTYPKARPEPVHGKDNPRRHSKTNVREESHVDTRRRSKNTGRRARMSSQVTEAEDNDWVSQEDEQEPESLHDNYLHFSLSRSKNSRKRMSPARPEEVQATPSLDNGLKDEKEKEEVGKANGTPEKSNTTKDLNGASVSPPPPKSSTASPAESAELRDLRPPRSTRKSSTSSTLAPSVLSRASSSLLRPSLSSTRSTPLQPRLDLSAGQGKFQSILSSSVDKHYPPSPAAAANPGTSSSAAAAAATAFPASAWSSSTRSRPSDPPISSDHRHPHPSSSSNPHRRTNSTMSTSQASDLLRDTAAGASTAELLLASAVRSDRSLPPPKPRNSSSGYLNGWIRRSNSQNHHQSPSSNAGAAASSSDPRHPTDPSPSAFPSPTKRFAPHKGASPKSGFFKPVFTTRFYSAEELAAAKRQASSTNATMGISEGAEILSPLRPSKSAAVLPEYRKDPHRPPRNSSTASLSRTQQKLLMQRDTPLNTRENNATMSLLYPTTTSGPSGLSVDTSSGRGMLVIDPTTSSQTPTSLNAPAMKKNAQENLHSWAQAIVREADRIDREHATVRRFYNPVEHSFMRIFNVHS